MDARQLDRRGFLRRLAVTTVALPIPLHGRTDAEIPKPATELLLRAPIAGLRYNTRHELLVDITVGDPVQLVLEPENTHDPDAVRVEHAGLKLGYLPRWGNQAVAARLRERDEGVRGAVTVVDAQVPLWRAVVVEVWHGGQPRELEREPCAGREVEAEVRDGGEGDGERRIWVRSVPI